MPNPESKPALRTLIRERLSALTDAERAEASAAISSALVELLAQSPTILIYLPMPSEVDISAAASQLAAQGTTLAAPRIDWDARTMRAITLDAYPPKVEHRRHNVPEPLDGPTIDPTQISAVLVPALAFDNTGQRLGRGGGFYDRYLPQLPNTAKRIGVCFEAQVVERVPVDTHDVRMHQVVCERGPIM